ncbi:MAG: diguanylate cyclase [Sulfuricurvum sp.]|nr:diguanylate cyclase [Sulfuricurvum sp.]
MKVFLFAVAFLSYVVYAKETSILSIHSYHEDYQWTKEQNNGFRETLDSIPDFYPAYSAEYLDTKRRAFDQDYEAEVVHYMRSKYKGYHPNIIYVTDDNALKFIIDHRKELFPNVPVVFSGINNQKVVDTLSKDSYTGVYEEKEIIPNLQLIHKLFPSEREVLLVGDGSSTSDVIQADIQQHESLIQGLRVRYLNNPSFESTLNALKAYKGKNVILTTIGGFHFANGKLVPLKEAIHKIVHTGGFHMLSMEDTFIVQGVLGGHADNGMTQGREAAKIVLQIITHPELPLPKRIQDTNGWIFDIQALKQQNIKLPDDIAAKSIFINRPMTFYQKNEVLITNFVYGLSVTLITGSLIFIWYLYRSRRIIAMREAQMASITMSLNKAQELSHLGNWVWDMKADSLWWSNEIYRIFGLEPQEFPATYEAFIQRVHPDDREAVNAAVNKAIANRTEYSIVHRILKTDGTLRYVQEEGSVEYEGEQPIKMNGMVQDITEAFKKEEELLLQAQIFDAVEDSIFVHDLEGRFIYLNESAWKTRGYTQEELMNMTVKELDAPQYASGHPERIKSAVKKMREQGHVRFRVDHLCKDGDRLPVEIYAKLITLNNTQYILSSARDIREQLSAQEKILQLSKVVEQIDDGVVITDKNGIITYVNRAFTEHTGFSEQEILGKTHRLLKSGTYDPAFYKALWKIILHGDVFRMTVVNRKKNGDLFYENKTITPLKDEEGNVTGFVSSGKDVTAETLLNKEMERIATIDKLTGIYNRHKFEEIFALEAERSRRFSQPLSLILIDIDHFKSVNDTYGHDIGDKVLQLMAKIIKENIRQVDVFARWGGEEFLVLSPSTDFDNIQILAEKLRVAVNEAIFPDVSHITISQGISTLLEEDTFIELFKRADMGLYHAKEHGRNQVGVITS